MRAPFRLPWPCAALVTAIVLAGFASEADARDGQATVPPLSQPQAAAQKQPALNSEDAALVQQLALVEHVELLRHLELFEKEPASSPKKQQ